MRKITELVWHCTATPAGREVSVAEITAWHKERGFKTIGYHKVVHLDGSVSEGRPESMVGAHVEGHNTGTLGYVYVGGMAPGMKGPKDTRTQAQKATMLRLTREAVAKYGITRISGHNEYANKACPSFNVRNDPLGHLPIAAPSAGLGSGTGHQHAATAASPAAKAPVPATRAPVKPVAIPDAAPEAGEAAPLADEALIQALQKALIEKGYAEVGMPDGGFETMTRGAILAFEADNGLPLTGAPTKELLAEVLAAPPRQLSQVRTEATPAEVREKVPEAKANFFAKISGMVVAVGGLLWGAIGGIIENVQGGLDLARPVLEVLGDVPWYVYAIAVAGAGFWLWRQSRKGEIKGIEAFQTGARR